MNAPQASAVPTYQRYPLVMRHPGEKPAVVSQWVWDPPATPGGVPTTGRHVPEHGEPARFQPVTVETADDEEYYAAKGYRADGGDAAAFEQQVQATILNPVPPGYVREEYPKWVNGVLVQDPSKPTSNFQEYPKWVGDQLVNNREQENALRAAMGENNLQGAAQQMQSSQDRPEPKPYVAQVSGTTTQGPELVEVTIAGEVHRVSPAVAAMLANQAQAIELAVKSALALDRQMRGTSTDKSPSANDASEEAPAETPRAAPKPAAKTRRYRDRVTSAAASTADVA